MLTQLLHPRKGINGDQRYTQNTVDAQWDEWKTNIPPKWKGECKKQSFMSVRNKSKRHCCILCVNSIAAPSKWHSRALMAIKVVHNICAVVSFWNVSTSKNMLTVIRTVVQSTKWSGFWGKVIWKWKVILMRSEFWWTNFFRIIQYVQWITYICLCCLQINYYEICK